MPVSTAMAEAGAYKLLAWLSPAMPVGAYSYSHGLESAVAAGRVVDQTMLRAYIATVLRHGSGRQDGLWLRAAYAAAAGGSFEGWSLADIVAAAAALRPTRELALESAAQGQALLGVLRQAWPAPALDRLHELCREDRLEASYAVVLGVACAAHRLPLAASLLAFLHAFTANLVSAGIRLMPLGQTAGQQLTAALEATVHEVTAAVMAGSLDDLGSAAPLIDLLSIAHETQYTRLFRS